MEVRGQLQGTHWIDGGVDRIFGMDDVEKRNVPALSGNGAQIPRYRPRDLRIKNTETYTVSQVVFCECEEYRQEFWEQGAEDNIWS
jgi:hypothetical protein